MSQFSVPTRNQVSEKNQAIFDNLESKLGFVPNLYATYAYSENALSDYLTFSGRKTSLSSKEKEVVNLIVSQINECTYCLSAHTAIGKMNGFTDDQILEIRRGEILFDAKLNTLLQFAKETASNKGKASEEAINNFLNGGYTKENLIDTIVAIGEKTISNYIHNVTDIPVDFPVAPELELV